MASTMGSAMEDATVIDVFADVVCPFAYIGLESLIARRAEVGRDDVRFRIRSWPLELVNGKPVDGAFIGEEIDEVKPQVAPHLFGGFVEAAFPATSIPALALTIQAYEAGPEVGERVAMALRRALFEEGRDVADPAVLHELAARNELEFTGDTADWAEAVNADYAVGRAAGVVGSPHFLVGDNAVFCPVLDIKRVDGKLHVAYDEAAAHDLMASIFG